MNITQSTLVVSTFLGLCLLPSCVSPTILGAMEGVSVEHDGRWSGGWSSLDQLRTTNASGILPFHDIGQVYKLKKQRKPSLAIPICEGPSQVVTVSYNSEATMSDLYAIRDSILKVREEVAVYALKVVQRASVQAELASLEKLKEVDTTDKQKKDIATLKTKIIQAEKDELTAKSSLATAERAAENEMNKKNIVVYNWQDIKKNRWSSMLSTIATLRVNDSKEKSGFVIVGGLEISYLCVGSNIRDQYSNTEMRTTRQRPVLTQVWKGEHVLSLASFEQEKEIMAQIKASYNQLKDLDKTIKKLDEIKISASLQRVKNLSNRTSLSEADISKRDFDFWYLPSNKKSSKSPFFSVHTHLNDLRDLFKK